MSGGGLTVAVADQAGGAPARSWAPGFLRQRNLQLYIGLGVLALIVLAAVFAPLLTRFDPTATDPSSALQGPSATHLLGTDNLGRDTWSRLLFGARIDLSTATLAVLVPFVIGVLIGTVAGYLGGWVDAVLMRLAEIVAAFPFFVFVIALVFVLGSGVKSIFISIAVVSWVAYARITRGETLILREREFVEASRILGVSGGRIVARHIIPNVVTQAIVYSMSDIVGNIGVIVTLSYFGLGIVPPTPDWGSMMANGQQFLAGGYYLLTLIPAAAVVLTSLALSLVGDGLAHLLRVRR